MSEQYFDINNTEVQMTLVMKLQQLQRESNTHITYQNLEEYACNGMWQKRSPRSLYVAVNDIMSIKASDVVKYLAKKAITGSSSSTLSDFTDLIRR